MGAKMTTIISLPGVSRMHDKLCREHLSEQKMGSKYICKVFHCNFVWSGSAPVSRWVYSKLLQGLREQPRPSALP